MSEEQATVQATAPDSHKKNGQVIRIKRKGFAEFAFGEDDPPFKVDIVATHDEWFQVDQGLRDENRDVPKGQLMAYNDQKLAWVQGIVRAAYQKQLPQLTVPVLTHAEASEFIARLQEETNKLRTFLFPNIPEQPSSPENTAVRFSQ